MPDAPLPPFVELIAPDGSSQEPGEAGFRVERSSANAGDGPIEEHELVVTFAGERPIEAGLRISVDLPHDAAPPTWLLPGLVYGENRPEGCRRLFPRYERGAADPGRMVSERWSFRADRCATPAAFGWSAGTMAALAVEETTALGPSGVGFEGSEERAPRVWLDLPYREEPVRYLGTDEPAAPDAATHRWQPGDSHTVRFWSVRHAADRHGYVGLLRLLHRHLTPAEAPSPWVSIEEAAALAADGLLRWHYHPEHRALYETAAFERGFDGTPGGEGDRPHMHVGWVSGAPWAAQLLAWGRRTGSGAHVTAGLDVLDHIAENLAPCGSFWAEWTLEAGWGTGWSPRGTIHANTVGQATVFFLRALAAEDAIATHVTWEAAVRSNLDALLARQRDDGNLGLLHDAETNAVTEWDGAAGLVWIPALLLGAERYAEPAYREAAVRAGSWYRRFVDDERICGAPEDVHLAPTSEDGANAVMAYVALHAATGEERWLDLARRAADWLLTFRYAYDVSFPPQTLLGRYEFRTRGTDQASPANQHLHHFGLLCQPELRALSRATGDAHYAERAQEALTAWRQFIARRDGDFNARRGMVSERFHQTDWARPKGSLLPLSHAWSLGVLLYACLDALESHDALPG